MNSATVFGDVIYIAGQPRYNHTGQVVVYKMEGEDINILQTLSGEQVSLSTAFRESTHCVSFTDLSMELELKIYHIVSMGWMKNVSFYRLKTTYLDGSEVQGV